MPISGSATAQKRCTARTIRSTTSINYNESTGATIMTKKTTTMTFRVTLGDVVKLRTTLPLTVVPTTYGAVVTDESHLRFNASYRDEQTAQAAAFIAMARRTR
jgi:hypothetical protein